MASEESLGEGNSEGQTNTTATPNQDTRSRKSKRSVDWHEIRLDGEGENSVPVYDDCKDVRRKIRKLQQTPGFRITHWLRDIGNIKYNSWSRFMKAVGPHAGAENSIYYAAYIYFEKVRIAEGKPKSAKREQNESEHPSGLSMRDRRHMWVFIGH